MFQWIKEMNESLDVFLKDTGNEMIKIELSDSTDNRVKKLLCYRVKVSEFLAFEKTKSEYGIESLEKNESVCIELRRIRNSIDSKLRNTALDELSVELKNQVLVILTKTKDTLELQEKESSMENLYEIYQKRILLCPIGDGKYVLSTQPKEDWLADYISRQLNVCEQTAFEYLNDIVRYKQECSENKGYKDLAVLSQSAASNNISLDVVNSLQNAIKENLPKVRDLIDHLHHNVEGKHLKSMRLRNSEIDVNIEIEYTIEEAVQLIMDAFETVDSNMADFVYKMKNIGLIDYRVNINKRSGACARNFQATMGHSVVQLQFDGSVSSVLTLAHELGHAYHHQVLTGVTEENRAYPLVFAETASMFAETVVLEHLLEKNKGTDLERLFKHQRLLKFHDLMIMVPSRFCLEKRIYNLVETDNLELDSFRNELVKNQEEWYPLHDEFDNHSSWMLVRHYFMPESQFYNYPYYFGYLLNVFFMKEKNKDGFNNKFHDFLLATGDANALNAWKQVFGTDLDSPQLWKELVDTITDTMLEDLKEFV